MENKNSNMNPFVRIKGNPERAAEVIAELERRGGVNKYKYSGCDSDAWYIIEPSGVIGHTEELSDLMREYYAEISLTDKNARWRAPLACVYHWISDEGRVFSAVDAHDSQDDERFAAGNYFRTEQAAKEAACKIAELLKTL